jgi:phage tail sheath gpL-like
MPAFPLAVAASVRTPGLALAVNLLAATTSPGSAPLHACVLGCKATGGTITADTDLRQGIAGADEAATLFGPGTPTHLAIKALFTEYPLAQVDVCAAAEPSGVAATQTLVFDSTTPVTVAQVVTLEIAGREATIAWLPGESDVAAAAKMALAIGALDADLPVTASTAGGATLTLTFKTKGKVGNDVLLYLTVKDGTGGAATLGGAALAGGTLEPSFVNVLSLISGKEYDLILPVVSNDDAAAASATSGPGRVKTHLNTHATGFSAKLQQAVVGLTATLSAAKVGAGQHDFGPMEYVHANKARSLGCEFAGAEVGARLREESVDPAVNRINTTYLASLYLARDLGADALTDAQVEDALQSGVTPVTFTSSSEPRVARPITTHWKDDAGNPDDRLLDVSRVSGIYAVAKDLRVALPQQFRGAKLSKDLPPGDDELPPGVVEERDVKAFVISRCRFWQKQGVVRRDKLDEAIAGGTLIVRVNPSDPSQCDIVLLAIVPPLAKFSLVVQKIA